MPRIYNRLYDRRGYGGLDMADEYRNDVPKEPGNDDDSSSPLIWGLLGFFIPIVGLTLFLAWHRDRPKDSKAAGIGALIGFITSVLVGITNSCTYASQAYVHPTVIYGG